MISQQDMSHSLRSAGSCYVKAESQFKLTWNRSIAQLCETRQWVTGRHADLYDIRHVLVDRSIHITWSVHHQP